MKTLLLCVVFLAVVGALWAQDDQALAAKVTAPAKSAIVRDKAEPKRKLDADEAYKSNCSRCHLAPRKYAERKMATIVRHMRVRANLPQAEAEAILEYLTR